METFPFELSAQLILTVQEDHVLVVAEENFIIVNFKDHLALERVMQNMLPPSGGSSSGGSFLSGAMEKPRQVNQLLRQAGLVLDVRVNNKTYVEFGTSDSPRISANAIFGKIGSFFKKGK